MKATMLLNESNSFAAMEVARRRGSMSTSSLSLLEVSVISGLRGTLLGIKGGRCHSLAKGSKVDRVVEGVSDIDRAGHIGGLRISGLKEPMSLPMGPR